MGSHVCLCPIARGKKRDASIERVGEAAQRAAQLIGREREALAHGDGRRLVADADERDVHRYAFAPTSSFGELADSKALEQPALRLTVLALGEQHAELLIDRFLPDLRIRLDSARAQLSAHLAEQVGERGHLRREVGLELFAEASGEGRARTAGRCCDRHRAAPDDGGQNEVAVLRVVGGIDPDAGALAFGRDLGVHGAVVRRDHADFVAAQVTVAIVALFVFDRPVCDASSAGPT